MPDNGYLVFVPFENVASMEYGNNGAPDKATVATTPGHVAGPFEVAARGRETAELRRALADRDAKIARLTAELDSMRDVPVEYVTEAGLEAAMTADPHRQDGTVLRETNGARRAFEWKAATKTWEQMA